MTTKLAQQFLERFRDLDTNSRGKYFGHKLSAELATAQAFARRTDRDGEAIVITFADSSRIKIEDPTQKTDRARFYQLGGI